MHAATPNGREQKRGSGMLGFGSSARTVSCPFEREWESVVALREESAQPNRLRMNALKSSSGISRLAFRKLPVSSPMK